MFDGKNVKEYRVYRHETPRVAKRSNKRFKHVKGETFKQLTQELYSVLSAIKKFYSCNNKEDPGNVGEG